MCDLAVVVFLVFNRIETFAFPSLSLPFLTLRRRLQPKCKGASDHDMIRSEAATVLL